MGAIIVIAVATLLPRVAAPQLAAPAPGDAGRCLTCHGMANLSVRDAGPSGVHDFSVSPQTFSASVHGRLTCQQCHGDVGAYPHQFSAGRTKVTCAQDCHARDAAGRPYTHRSEVDDFEISAHRVRASGSMGDRPTCVTCHGWGDPHAIAPAKGKSLRERMAFCVDCHDDRARMAKNGVELDAVRSYRRSFHYKAITFGARQAAVCQDCHSTHRILPASDSRSSIAHAALPATCGQAACHPGARTSFAVSGANHLDLRVKREPILWAEERLFWVLTSGTMVMLVIGIALDVQKKFGWVPLARGLVIRVRRHFGEAIGGGRRAIRFARYLLLE